MFGIAGVYPDIYSAHSIIIYNNSVGWSDKTYINITGWLSLFCTKVFFICDINSHKRGQKVTKKFNHTLKFVHSGFDLIWKCYFKFYFDMEEGW